MEVKLGLRSCQWLLEQVAYLPGLGYSGTLGSELLAPASANPITEARTNDQRLCEWECRIGTQLVGNGNI